MLKLSKYSFYLEIFSCHTLRLSLCSVAFFMLPGVAFSNCSTTSFSFNSDAKPKRFSLAAIVSWGKVLKLSWRVRLPYLEIMVCEIYFIWNSYLHCGCRWKWRVIIAVNFPSNWKEEAWKISGLQRESNPAVNSATPVRCSTNWVVKPHISYIFHIISLHGKIWTQQIDLAPNVWLHSSDHRTGSRRSQIRITLKPRLWYIGPYGSYTVMAEPIKSLELHHPMIQLLISRSN